MTNQQVATKQDIDEVITILREFMMQVDGRFTRNESSLFNIQTQVANLSDSQAKLVDIIDSLVGRIDTYETEQLARDARFDHLLGWAKKVAVKTDTPLKNI